MTSAQGVQGIPQKQAPNSQANQKTTPRPHITEIYEMPNGDYGDTHEATARGLRGKFLILILPVRWADLHDKHLLLPCSEANQSV
jgi:hypothetical protein